MERARRTEDLSTDEVLRRAARAIDTVVDRPLPHRVSDADTPILAGGLAVDSLAKINLIIALEEEFDLAIDETSIPPSALHTVGAVAQFVHEQLRQR